MICSEHARIRATGPDDAAALHAFYAIGRPYASLLDKRREPFLPTVDELREMLGRKEAADLAFYTVEDPTGIVRGFCSLRGMMPETNFGEVHVLFHELETYASPIGEAVFQFLRQRGFQRFHLHKLLAHALEGESAWRESLLRQGFISEGVQREVLYCGGHWHSLESFALFATTQDGAELNT